MVIVNEATRRLLITAGPTYEPIDAVRFIGNRSSGRLGTSLAEHAAALGWEVSLLLGPNAIEPTNPQITLERFQSTSDLENLLQTHLPESDVLIMAAAVADYRPAPEEVNLEGKRRREGGNLSIRLESTPDLLAGCSKIARDDQLLVGFALEPKDRMISSALSKLARKNIDLIVANALETMDSDSIEATLIGNTERGVEHESSTSGTITKTEFAKWLLTQLEPLTDQRKSINA
ncbi:MAG: phosphopantothenoylcysteine decarboxylase [Phycisphaerales bacterium]|nr:phosphopantothenoylcysteine decarboxylase [Phycisphaerales bacterium]